MNTTFRFVCSVVMIACFSLSSSAQRQQALYIDNGFGAFTKLTATGAGGTLNLPSSGSLLSSDSGQVIAGTFTLGIDGPTNAIAGQLNILNGGNTGDTAAFLWQNGVLTLQFPSYTPPSSGAGINLTAQTGLTGGGGVSIVGGQAGLSGAGGAVGIAGGAGAGPGGQATLAGGVGANADGGEVLVEGGNSSGSSGNGGEALVAGGNGNPEGTTGGTGGALSLSSGAGGVGGTNGGSGGACTLSGGAGANGTNTNGGNGGSVSISGGAPGTGVSGHGGVSGSPGSVSIQTTAGNTSIGNATGGTSITGTNWSINDATGNLSTSGDVNIGSGPGLNNNIASGGGGSENFFGASPRAGNAVNNFGVSTESDGNVHNFMGNNGDEGTATNDIEGNNSSSAATTIATYNMANNSVSMGNVSSTVAITSGSGATAWSVTSAGAASVASVISSGSVTASTYYGDGSNLTGLSTFTPAYLNVYYSSIFPETVPGRWAEIPLPTIAVISGFTTDNSGEFTVAATGRLQYGTYGQLARDEPSSLAISVNGVVAAKSGNGIFNSLNTGTTVVHGNAIVSLNAGDVIMVVASPHSSVAISVAPNNVTGTVEASLDGDTYPIIFDGVNVLRTTLAQCQLRYFHPPPVIGSGIVLCSRKLLLAGRFVRAGSRRYTSNARSSGRDDDFYLRECSGNVVSLLNICHNVLQNNISMKILRFAFVCAVYDHRVFFYVIRPCSAPNQTLH